MWVAYYLRMKRFKFFIAVLATLIANYSFAQVYVVDTQSDDSLIVNELNIIKGKEAVGVPMFKIANGDTVVVNRQIEDFRHYAAIRIDGKEYAVEASQLCFIDEEGVADPWNTLQEKWRTPEGRYYNTLTPYLYIIYLVVGAILLGLMGLKVRVLRFVARLLMPIMIAGACYIEINAWLALQSDMFWWCDMDRYGFWGSALRVFPFLLVLVSQIMCYKLYKMLIFDKQKPETGQISILPMAVSFVVSIPVIFIVLLICAIFHMGKPMQSNIGFGLFATIVGIGSLISFVINIRAIGLIRGLWFSLFGAIYIIGAMISVFGFCVALWHLFIQIVVTIAPWAILAMIVCSNPKEPDSNDTTKKGHKPAKVSDEQKRLIEHLQWKHMLKGVGKDTNMTHIR